jgi:hypothetical protein
LDKKCYVSKSGIHLKTFNNRIKQYVHSQRKKQKVEKNIEKVKVSLPAEVNARLNSEPCSWMLLASFNTRS